jgi:hypothetical protein
LSAVEVVFGVGAITEARSPATTEKLVSTLGYRAVERADLVDDILSDGARLDAPDVVQVALPALLKRTWYVPVYKFLRQGGYLDDEGSLTRTVPDKVRQVIEAGIALLRRGNYYERRFATLFAEGVTFDEILDREDPVRALWYAPLVRLDRIDPDRLKKFLTDHREFLGTFNESQYFKVVCLYDLIRYGPPI